MHINIINDIEEMLCDIYEAQESNGKGNGKSKNNTEKVLGEKILGKGKIKKFYKFDIYGKYFVDKIESWKIKDICDLNNTVNEISVEGIDNFDIYARANKRAQNGQLLSREEVERLHKMGGGDNGRDGGVEGGLGKVYYLDRVFITNLVNNYNYKGSRAKLISKTLNTSMMEIEVRKEVIKRDYSDGLRNEGRGVGKGGDLGMSAAGNINYFEVFMEESIKKIDQMDIKIDKLFKLFEKIAPTPEEKLMRVMQQEKTKQRIAQEVRQKYIEFENQKIINKKKNIHGLVYDMSAEAERDMIEREIENEKERKMKKELFYDVVEIIDDEDRDDDSK
jgi:hypothetical protein